MIQKAPRQPEFFRQDSGQGLHPKRLGGIVAAVEYIQSRVLGQRMGPMRAFASNESVHAFAARNFQFGPRAACHYADSPALHRTAGQ